MASDPLRDRRLLLFTGKGGVGKSTIVAALAVAAAARGLRPLVVELGHRASMGGLLAGGRAIGHAPAAVDDAGRIHAMNLDQEAALFDHVLAQVKVRRLARAIVDTPALRRLFGAAPMVRELVTLTRLAALEAEEQAEREGGGPRWQPILVDLDASGHARMLLDLPRVLRELAPAGPLATTGRRLEALLGDPARALLVLVTLAREVPAQETIELEAALREGGLAAGGLVINQVPAPPIADALLPTLAWATERAFSRVHALPGGSPLALDLAFVRRCQGAHGHAVAALGRLRAHFAGLPRAEVGERPGGVDPAADLRAIGEEVLRDMSSWPDEVRR